VSSKTNHRDAIRNRNLASRAMPVFDDALNIQQNIEQNTNKNSIYNTDKLTEQNIEQNTKLSSNQNNTQNIDESLKGQSSITVATEEIGSFLHEMLNVTDKPRVEDTHTRRTYLIENEIVERLDAESKRRPRGWPTKLVNGLLRAYFNEQDRVKRRPE